MLQILTLTKKIGINSDVFRMCFNTGCARDRIEYKSLEGHNAVKRVLMEPLEKKSLGISAENVVKRTRWYLELIAEHTSKGISGWFSKLISWKTYESIPEECLKKISATTMNLAEFPHIKEPIIIIISCTISTERMKPDKISKKNPATITFQKIKRSSRWNHWRSFRITLIKIWMRKLENPFKKKKNLYKYQGIHSGGIPA